MAIYFWLCSKIEVREIKQLCDESCKSKATYFFIGCNTFYYYIHTYIYIQNIHTETLYSPINIHIYIYRKRRVRYNNRIHNAKFKGFLYICIYHMCVCIVWRTQSKDLCFYFIIFYYRFVFTDCVIRKNWMCFIWNIHNCLILSFILL